MRPEPWLLLLACSLMLATGCASLTPPPARGMNLGYTPPVAAAPGGGRGPSDERPRSLASPPPSPRSAHETRQAVLGAVGEVKGSTRSSARALSRLAGRRTGIGGSNGAFSRHVTHGIGHLQWMEGALAGATTLADAALELHEPEMELALLRMSGPRLQAAMSGALLLAAWVDFLNLADAVLQQCPAYSVEKLVRDMHRVQGMVEPSLRALASLDPEQVEVAAVALPELMSQLTGEFQTIREGARVAMERAGHFMAAAQLVEMLTLASTLKLALPRLPPAAPATLGAGLVMGSNGVMAGSQVVVSAEWVELMRRLVQAGVLSASAVHAAVRIHAGGVMMAHGDLRKGVRDALGEGPEVRGMHETGRAGAGMAEPPKHHILPREFREWFEQRGFTGDMSIDQFCVRMERSHHEAIHGGGDWRLGRMWPGEWNRMIMEALLDAEAKTGRMLTRSQILKVVAREMKRYNLPMDFTAWRGP